MPESAASLDLAGLTIPDCSRRLGVSDRTVRRWISEGLLPAHRLGAKLLRVRVADLERFAGAR